MSRIIAFEAHEVWDFVTVKIQNIVDRMSDEHRYAIVPIDQCYELVGTIKLNWTGISGGTSVEDAVAAFFTRLARSAAGS